MKGRSHRFQSHHDSHDDWVDGSWTVDCVCGVNFDDGEEMVNCDDCGVWVHTRCSRYVKGEELFTCDKCKAKNNRNDSEETEVAQLLVELPTKTIRLESDFVANGPPRRPFRLWTDIPMEERVHVQGIPGGDSALFSGFSSIFSRELWKCTGYVPKKFNFQYREFPCWEEDNNGDHEGEKLNAVDKGAGVFLSLSKESVLATSAVALIGMRGKHGKEGCFDKKNEDVGHQQIGVKKERSLLRSVVVPSGRRREELGSSKDRSRKNRARALDMEGDISMKSLHASAESVFTSASDGKPLDFYEDRSSKSFTNDSQGTKNMNLMDASLQRCGSIMDASLQRCGSIMDASLQRCGSIMDASLQRCGSMEYDAVSSGAEKPKGSLEGSLEALSCDTSNVNFPVGFGSKERKHGPVVVPVVDSSAKVITSSALKHTDVGKLLVKLEGDGILNVNPDNNMEVSAASDLRPPNNELPSAAEEVKMKQIDVSGGTYPSSSSVCPIIKVEVHDSDSRGVLNGILVQNMPENSKKNGVASSCLPDHRAQEADQISEDIGDYQPDKYLELKNDFCQPKQEFDCAEGTMSMQKCTSEPKHSSGFTEVLSASIGTNLTVPRLPSQQRIFSEKLSSNLSAVMTSKSSASENFRSADAVNSSPDTKQVVLHEFHAGLKKERATIDVGTLEDWHEKSIKTEKEHPKTCSVSMVTNSGKMSHAYLPKQTVSDANDSLLYSSKASLVSVETVGSLQNECDSLVQNRAPSSTLPLRSEKFNHFANQLLSKANHTVSMNLSAAANSPAALSDEELALLLHQELNSSPRVPRVPRVRQAGSLPRLTSPTAISMLVKRTSGSGGKDCTLSSRRINRDAYKDGVCRSHERDVEDKRTGRVPLSPDWRRPDSGSSADISSKREGNSSPMSIHSIKKNVPTASTSTANSGPSSSTEVNDHRVSSLHNSPKTISDEETGTIGGPVHQTLPGLINEIMSKGKRMTYEELCNAVLPHWHNLRKHNGERYAYSSHSQAVLDCLRNRHEWARLVDRGPKTNTSRKRRKLDAEESDDNEYGGRALKVRESKNLEAQREDYPKGKRKARKRRLAPQGRGIKDVRKRRKLDSVTDDDIGPVSHTTEESLFSEDEIEGGGGASVGMEASASLDDAGKMQL